MKFTRTELGDVLIIDQQPHRDVRGFFARTFCRDELLAEGVKFDVFQANASFNAKAGTVRGMHFQTAPHEEPKIVSCVRGAIHDVVIDLRRDSPTFRRWIGVDLTEENRRALYVPPGFAHGFQALKDATEVNYLMGAPYVAGAASGVRWNDPAFAVRWPLPVSVISERDDSYPPFES